MPLNKLQFKKMNRQSEVGSPKSEIHASRKAVAEIPASTRVTIRYLRNPRRSTSLRVGQCREAPVKCECYRSDTSGYRGNSRNDWN